MSLATGPNIYVSGPLKYSIIQNISNIALVRKASVFVHSLKLNPVWRGYYLYGWPWLVPSRLHIARGKGGSTRARWGSSFSLPISPCAPFLSTNLCLCCIFAACYMKTTGDESVGDQLFYDISNSSGPSIILLARPLYFYFNGFVYFRFVWQ